MFAPGGRPAQRWGLPLAPTSQARRAVITILRLFLQGRWGRRHRSTGCGSSGRSSPEQAGSTRRCGRTAPRWLRTGDGWPTNGPRWLRTGTRLPQPQRRPLRSAGRAMSAATSGRHRQRRPIRSAAAADTVRSDGRPRNATRVPRRRLPRPLLLLPGGPPRPPRPIRSGLPLLPGGAPAKAGFSNAMIP